MKKIVIIIVIIACIILFKNENSKTNDEIRIRILANSDELVDQLNKLIVKDEVIKILKEDRMLINRDNINEFEKKLKNNLDMTLSSQIKVEYKKTNFPAKSQNGKILKAGKYQTILITIKNGKGKNWWSVLYPEFFGVEYDDNNEIEYKLYIKRYFENKWKIRENVHIYLH